MLYKMLLIGNVASQAINTPSIPEEIPKIHVSASNTRVMSFFRAPKAFSTPISFVRSITDV